MTRVASFILPIALLASACSAFSPSSESSTSQTGAGVNEPTDAPFEATYPSVFVRGTPNGWDLSPMRLVADHEWTIELESGSTDDERFKFDIKGDWSMNFGDNEGDQIADADGHDIALPAAKPLFIHFNDLSGFYWVEERTWQAEVAIKLPQGIDRFALDRKQLQLAVDGQPYGWNYIYADGDHATAWSPVCCLARGAKASVSFDQIVGNKRLVGQADWTVDGKTDPIALELVLEEASLGNYGAVNLQVVSDRWESGGIVTSPYANANVYLGDWHAGNMLGSTGDDGKVSLMIPAGEQTLSAMLMTSSHSMASGSMALTVEAGSFVSTSLHIAPLTVVVTAHFDAGWNNALYVTGASDYLGNWKQASRMTYDPGRGVWVMQGNLPVGLPFKLVLAPWSDSATISTSGVKWEKGPNRVVTPPQGYYQTELDAYPTF